VRRGSKEGNEMKGRKGRTVKYSAIQMRTGREGVWEEEWRKESRTG
jgi:hypothetical protein